MGSTSVAGLAAKPTVDILLEIKDGYDADEMIGLLQNNGWILMARDEGTKDALDFNKGYTPKGFAQKV
ncbi:GrpB family protein [Syntrophomonas curvata]